MEKTLRIELAAWSDEAARFLAATVRGAPCFGVEDYRRELEANPDCRLYRGTDEAGRVVGYLVLRVERCSAGAEGVLVAASGRLAGARMYAQLLPQLERLFVGVRSFRAEACRSGAVRELMRAGYLPTHFVMRKAAPAPAMRDDTLEALQACGGEAMGDGRRGSGGPDLRSRPGRLHGGGGGRSSSQSSQETNNVDRRLVVDNGGIGFSSDGGTYSINVLDGGAVSGALALVDASDQRTQATVNDLLGFTRDVFVSGLTVLDRAGKHVESQTALVAKAYDTAQGEGTQKNLVAAAALAAVAIVAVKVWGK